MSDRNDGGGLPILAVFAVLVVIVTGLGFVVFLFDVTPSVSVSVPTPFVSSSAAVESTSGADDTTTADLSAEGTRPAGRIIQDDVEIEVVDGWATWNAKINRLSIYMSPTRLNDGDVAVLEGKGWNVSYPKLTPPDGWNWYPYMKLQFDFTGDTVDLAAVDRLSLYCYGFEKQNSNVAVISSPQTDTSLFISALRLTEGVDNKCVELETSSESDDLQDALTSKHSWQWAVSGSFSLHELE